MEGILKDIKNTLKTKPFDEWSQRIPEWRNQFRQMGISIIALEELLNFFSEPCVINSSHADNAFFNPLIISESSDIDEKYLELRTELIKIEKENQSLKRHVGMWRAFFIISVAVIFILCVVILLMI